MPKDRDQELINKIRGGDYSSFTELVNLYQERVYRLVLGITKNEMDAQDVLQDVFLNVYRKLEGFKGDASFATWLYRIAVNQALMKVRARSSNQEMPGGDKLSLDLLRESKSPPSDWTDQADQLYEQAEMVEQIEKAVALLPEKYRVVFLLRDVEGLTTGEAAESLGIKDGTVKVRLHRARLFLRKKLEEIFQSSYVT